jgi:lysozyme family protein
MEVRQWDFVAYKIGGKIAVGTVLQCLDRGAVRVDTDGVIGKKCIVAVEHGKGKDVIYRSKAYTENESYRVWLRDNYGLPIKEV